MFKLDPTQDVFNMPALIIGCVTMLFCLLIQAFFAHTASLRFKPVIAARVAKRKPFTAQLVFLAAALMLLFSHLIQIWVWGAATFLSGVEQNAHKAMVFAGSTYTTVGFYNDALPLSWQLVTIIMATSGLFSFGWSTSVMFLLAQALYPSER